MLNSMNTAKKSSRKESKTASLMKPQSSLMCVSLFSPVRLTSIEDISTFLQQDSLANLSQWQASERGGETTEICGPKPSRPFAELDHATRCWRTYQVCLLTNMADEYSQTWPKQGLMRDGVCSEQTMWVRRTSANASGYLPTPTARDWKDNGKSPAELARNSVTLATRAGGKLNPMWIEWLMGWPIGWTDLKPWAMGKYPQSLQKRGES